MSRSSYLIMVAAALLGCALVIGVTSPRGEVGPRQMAGAQGAAQAHGVLAPGERVAERAGAPGRRVVAVRGFAALEREFGVELTGKARESSIRLAAMLAKRIDQFDLDSLVNQSERLVTCGGELKLTGDQEAQLKRMYAEFAARKLAGARATAERLRADPAPLARLILVRSEYGGQVDDAQWDEFRARTAVELGELTDVFDWIDLLEPYGFPDFRRIASGLIDPSQQDELQRLVGDTGARGPAAVAEVGVSNLNSRASRDPVFVWLPASLGQSSPEVPLK